MYTLMVCYVFSGNVCIQWVPFNNIKTVSSEKCEETIKKIQEAGYTHLLRCDPPKMVVKM